MRVLEGGQKAAPIQRPQLAGPTCVRLRIGVPHLNQLLNRTHGNMLRFMNVMNRHCKDKATREYSWNEEADKLAN